MTDTSSNSEHNRVFVKDIESLNLLLDEVEKSQNLFQLYRQEDVDEIFKQCAIVANQNRYKLAKLAVEEAGMGNIEDKTIKNQFSSETVYNAYKNMKTCGIVDEDLQNGFALYAESIGILAAVIPCTNPTSTTIFKALIALKTRNCIVFSPHPRTAQCTIETAKLLKEAAVKSGAPPNCIGWIDVPSIELCKSLMCHPKVSMIVATGAGALIRTAYSSGKPCMGGSSGNTPVIIDETADIALSVNSVLLSKTFDNGMICASEQAIVAVESVADKVKEEFIRRGGYFLENEEDKDSLAKTLFTDKGALNPNAVGKSAEELISMANITRAPRNARIILTELNNVGSECTLSREKLCPCLGFYRAKDYDQALEVALRLIRFGGMGHTSVLYTDTNGENYKERLQKFESLLPTGRSLICMPTSHGAIGGLYNAKQPPSMSLGCGSWGGNSTAEGLQPKHLLNYKQVAERRNSQTKQKLPEKIYMKESILSEALENIMQSFRGNAETAGLISHIGVICTDSKSFSSNEEKDFFTEVIRKIKELLSKFNIKVSTFSPVDVCSSNVKFLYASFISKLADDILKYDIDGLIAVGNTHILDSAKLVRVMSVNENIDWDALGMRFFNLEQRIVKFPQINKKIKKLICIPTFSGSGAEMSPYALIINDLPSVSASLNKILTIVDMSLMPDAVIVDFDFVKHVSPESIIEAGFCALSNTLEALVSSVSTESTRKLSEEALRLIIENFEAAVSVPSDIPKKNLLKAASINGMASAHSFLGIAESLSHQLTKYFDISNGLAKIMILGPIIMYNSDDFSSKLPCYPEYDRPKARAQYAEAIRSTNLCSKNKQISDEESINILILYLEKIKELFKVPNSLKAYGIDEKKFMSCLDTLAFEAFDDQFTSTNPRYPLVTDLVGILIEGYYGNSDNKIYKK